MTDEVLGALLGMAAMAGAMYLAYRRWGHTS